ncbi:MAG: D-alanyl-D-alanine carboxypeptidase [Spirochaetales bacterium]|nr:D-alanyl-D-alanine carboxypeptidase [Spirochaetales bacterium]
MRRVLRIALFGPLFFYCTQELPVIAFVRGIEQSPTAVLDRLPVASEAIGLFVVDPGTQEVLLEHNGRESFIPASTLKLLPAVLALERLGPEHTFRTDLLLDGRVNGQALEGDLFLRGGGDPALQIADLAALIRQSGLHELKEHRGRFFYDESYLPARESLLLDRDPFASYNPGLGALTLERNLFAIAWEKERLSILPPLPLFRANLERGKQNDYRYEPEGEKELWTVLSREGRGLRYLPVKKPGLYTALTFQKLCRDRGLPLARPESTTESRGKLFAGHHSDGLRRIAREILYYSNNVMAELLALHLTRELTVARGSTDEQAENQEQALKAFLATRFPAIPWDNLVLKDGSGLSSENRISPQQLATFLVLGDRITGVDLETLLPIGGWNGTMVDRLQAETTALRVHAKSGTLAFAVSTAGYLYAQSGRRLAFVLFLNDQAKRQQFEKGGLSREGSNWIRQQKETMDQILTRIILSY